ncbi:MAG: ABC transporter permease [Chloroflexota bacterium]|nr:ABC transporter permease [Chloroflexota bacterium]
MAKTLVTRRDRLQAGLSFPRSLMVLAKRKPLGAFGALILLTMIVMAVGAPVLGTQDPNKMSVSNRFVAPGAHYWFGTDNYGRDVYSRIVYGARVSLYVGFFSVILGVGLGTAVGITGGYFLGKLDLTIQRIVDILLAFPPLLLALVISTSVGPSLNTVVVAVAIPLAAHSARVMRSQAMAIRENTYVEAARAIGSSDFRILLRDIAPNCMPVFIVVATVQLAHAILVEASLSFLGGGVPPPHASWGRMLSSEAMEFTRKAPWLLIFPGVALSLAVYGFNLLGDAVRDVLDPRERGRGRRKI